VETTRGQTTRRTERDGDLSALQMSGKGHRSHTTIVIRRLLHSPQGVVGGIILILLVTMALTAPVIAPHDPLQMSVVDQFKPPSTENFFGTDEFGRDVFSRVIYGAQVSLRVGLLATLIAVGGGTVLGLTSGYFGRWVDSAGQKIMDTLLAFNLGFGLSSDIARWVLRRTLRTLGPELRAGTPIVGLEPRSHHLRLIIVPLVQLTANDPRTGGAWQRRIDGRPARTHVQQSVPRDLLQTPQGADRLVDRRVHGDGAPGRRELERLEQRACVLGLPVNRGRE
jgi:hypothetical protein